jgi:hypothetical protein
MARQAILCGSIAVATTSVGLLVWKIVAAAHTLPTVMPVAE